MGGGGRVGNGGFGITEIGCYGYQAGCVDQFPACILATFEFE